MGLGDLAGFCEAFDSPRPPGPTTSGASLDILLPVRQEPNETEKRAILTVLLETPPRDRYEYTRAGILATSHSRSGESVRHRMRSQQLARAPGTRPNKNRRHTAVRCRTHRILDSLVLPDVLPSATPSIEGSRWPIWSPGQSPNDSGRTVSPPISRTGYCIQRATRCRTDRCRSAG